MENRDTLTLSVKNIIGTGDPSDVITLIPLISQWGVPRECAYGALTGEGCEKPLARLYVLNEPIQGHSVVGMCREHHETLTSPKDEIT